MSKIEVAVTELITPRLESLGFELWDVNFYKNHEGWNLSIEVDREGGVDMDAISVANEHINELLDEADLIDRSYNLEVSSPGLDRELISDRDFVRFAGREVEVKTYEAINGSKFLTGVLAGKNGDIVTIEAGGKSIDIPAGRISKINLAVVF
jgi:ribosome maturation factor RimP